MYFNVNKGKEKSTFRENFPSFSCGVMYLRGTHMEHHLPKKDECFEMKWRRNKVSFWPLKENRKQMKNIQLDLNAFSGVVIRMKMFMEMWGCYRWVWMHCFWRRSLHRAKQFGRCSCWFCFRCCWFHCRCCDIIVIASRWFWIFTISCIFPWLCRSDHIQFSKFS